MFSLLATVGVSAVADGDQASMENVSASKPGIFKKAYNFCWGKRSGLTKAGIATAVLLPSVLFLSAIVAVYFDPSSKIAKKSFLYLIPGISHFVIGDILWDKAKECFCS